MLKQNRSRFAAVLAVSLLLSAHAQSAEAVKIATESLQHTLLSRHAAWQAKENWVTRLPLEEIKRMMGVARPPDPNAQFSVPQGPAALGSEAQSFDWRNKDGINWISPILNQGNCGSCVAFAAVGVLESQVNITSGIPGLNPSFSTQALFACGGGGCESGWDPGSAASYMHSYGVPDEACAPYTMGSTGVDVSCSTVCSDAPSRSLKLVKSTQPSLGALDITSVKAALAHGPLVTTMTVYADFIAYSSGIYKHVTGDSLGGHAIAIVGYDDGGRYWIVRNNWGADWGEGGFFRVSYDDVSGISEETWAYHVPQAQGYVTVRNPHGRKFISGVVQLDAESTFPQTTALELTVYSNGSATAVNLPSCDHSPCMRSLDTTKLPNGKYEVYASAQWGVGKTTTSEHEQFFVFNGKPKLTIGYKMENGVDLTQPLTDRIVFDLTSSTGESSVPLSQVALHVVKDGKEIETKASFLVLPQMTLGWRTNSVADGKYEIWVSGGLTTSSSTVSVETPHLTVTTHNGVRD